MCKMWNKNKSFYPKIRGTHINYILQIFIIFLSHYNYYIYTIANYFRYKIQIEVFYATDKTNFVIFDRDIEIILNKSTRDFVEK